MIYVASIQCFLQTMCIMLNKRDITNNITLASLINTNVMSPYYDVIDLTPLNVPTSIVASWGNKEEKDDNYAEHLMEERSITVMSNFLSHVVGNKKDAIILYPSLHRFKEDFDRIDIICKYIKEVFMIDVIDLDKDCKILANPNKLGDIINIYEKQVVKLGSMLKWVTDRALAHGIRVNTQFDITSYNMLEGKVGPYSTDVMRVFLTDYADVDCEKMSNKRVKTTFVDIIKEMMHDEQCHRNFNKSLMMNELIYEWKKEERNSDT